MNWDGERAGLWNIGFTETEGFISKESLWVESWMTRGKGSVSVSGECGSEGITSLLFLLKAQPFSLRVICALLDSNTCSSSWYLEQVQTPGCLSMKVYFNDKWSLIGLRSLGKEIGSSSATKPSHLFNLLHWGASGKRGLTHLKYINAKCLSLTS